VPKIVDHDRLREEYLDAMFRVIERDGAGAVSVRSVAAEAALASPAHAGEERVRLRLEGVGARCHVLIVREHVGWAIRPFG